MLRQYLCIANIALPMTGSIYPEFDIQATGVVSGAMRQSGLHTFGAAMDWVRRLPYGRNTDKEAPLALFSERRGTCSTKHALLKRLAAEHRYDDIRLYIGIFEMNAVNTPAVASTLQAHNLACIPEAHCYLKYRAIL